jgi:Ca2+-binding RTX toxin-like protein
MNTTHTVPFHPVRPWRRRSRDALCALSLVAVVFGALAVVLASGPAGASQRTDPTGRYVMTDSLEAGGPRFHPVTVTNDLHLGDDDEANVTLPFDFSYYGQAYHDVTVGENGAITFPANRQVPANNVRLGDITSNLVAPWWDSWDIDTHGQVLTGVVGQAPRRTFVVWWKDLAHSQPGGGYASFQAQLFEGTNRIEFHYLQTQVTASPYGGAGTVGIDNLSTSNLQYSFNYQVLRNDRAIRFEPATCDGLPVTILGTPGRDDITGTGGDDVILTLNGDDHVYGGPGVDIVCGGRGNDVIEGGTEADHLLGGAGLDDLVGRAGADLLDGGAGIDHLAGGGGTDTCRGGPGHDTSSLCEVKLGLP